MPRVGRLVGGMGGVLASTTSSSLLLIQEERVAEAIIPPIPPTSAYLPLILRRNGRCCQGRQDGVLFIYRNEQSPRRAWRAAGGLGLLRRHGHRGRGAWKRPAARTQAPGCPVWLLWALLLRLRRRRGPGAGVGPWWVCWPRALGVVLSRSVRPWSSRRRCLGAVGSRFSRGGGRPVASLVVPFPGARSYVS
jgi:hypothetical protein